ncbi:MAG: hypothetical protein KDB03_05880 [Planctomycetales bacterium]|nr:hypothetical protein [Planctomycetales bacterium]
MRDPKRPIRACILAGVLSLFLGCGGVVGEVAIVVTVIKLLAIGATAVLTVAGTYWMVESARLDAAKRQLILEGMKDGRPAHSTIKLTDEQLRTIEDTGALKIKFEDGREIEVQVDYGSSEKI